MQTQVGGPETQMSVVDRERGRAFAIGVPAESAGDTVNQLAQDIFGPNIQTGYRVTMIAVDEDGKEVT